MDFSSTKTLPIGFTHNGQKITQVTARPVMVRHSIEAIEELGANVSQARLQVGIEARQVRFEGVPEDEHKIDMLLNLADADYSVVVAAIDEAEKKQKAPKPA
ncbi:hypothetical protein FHW83_004737 [Duganella sp. SG902]|uniref:hypothetical protein n=1 Tax=Duganella sp. SG902 TaxID=2587016 RepID=UPI00159D8A6E|nr:hypothetical protein [Duganella sp. SG902]NVM78906.1 hypothetical protein [Duganella sp. SG902]